MIQDDQQSSGAVTNFVPSLGTGAGAPNWQTVYPSIVHTMWKYGGDVQVVSDHFTSLEVLRLLGGFIQYYWDGKIYYRFR